MTRYAQIQDGSVVRYLNLTDEQIADIPPHKAGLVVPAPVAEAPSYNRATHHPPTRQPDVVHADRVEQVWNAPAAKTQAEIDAETKDVQDEQLARVDRIDSFERALAKALFAVYNEMKTLHEEQTITMDQFKAYLRSLM